MSCEYENPYSTGTAAVKNTVKADAINMQPTTHIVFFNSCTWLHHNAGCIKEKHTS
jgi:hypothetical protein